MAAEDDEVVDYVRSWRSGPPRGPLPGERRPIAKEFERYLQEGKFSQLSTSRRSAPHRGQVPSPVR